ncbi:unnamed protein product [Parnassius apollo]|uniref:(apollo) hypothetical protein n=1 Tax=Parnassius apollo TaxID=110799 RepID=A0A8S3X6Q8_PARAO|nr:unnamed protein product [Parnassius apollo]
MEAVAEWTKIFPKHITESYTSSVRFMKQLTVVAMSTITYLKNVFPEDSYMVETFGGLKIRILKKKCRDETAQFLSTALIQAFEAFDKKYLHKLALCFYEDKCEIENLIEYHIFEYSYKGDGVTMNIHSKGRNSSTQTFKCTFDDVKERTIHMMRACVVIMESCQQLLPPSYEISVRLYYNEDAPMDYQAPGFQSADIDEDHLASTLSETIKMGWVETPFHKLVARSYRKDNLKSSHEAIASQNPPVMSQNEMAELTASSRKHIPEEPYTCPCYSFNIDEVYDSSDMLTCFYCKTKQHAVCFGVLKEQIASIERHCCTNCSDSDPTREPTDVRLKSLGLKQRESLCIYRRTLSWCLTRTCVSVAQLSDLGVSNRNARKLVDLLRSHGVLDALKDTDPEIPQNINKNRLKVVIGKLFLNKGAENNDNRLLEGSFASQESRPDFVENVSSLMDKINHQNVTNVGQVADLLQDLSTVEDIPSQQYNEGVFSNAIDEEMPLGTPKKGKLGKGKRKLEEKEKPTRTGVRTKRARILKNFYYRSSLY